MIAWSDPLEANMSTRSYRLTLVVCALAWFMVGMHSPIFHAWTSHGHAPSAPALIATLLLSIIAVVALVALLRTPVSTTAGPA
jgi:hypothetical protein